MYIYKKRYLYNVKDVELKINNKIVDVVNLNNLVFEEVYWYWSEEVYWRKVNAVHGWFVSNIQDGNDDCKEYYVSTNDFIKLVEDCKKDLEYFKTLDYDIKIETNKHTITRSYKIYKNVDESELNLNLIEGFFFGNNEYDSDYVEDLEDTIEKIETLLSKEDYACYDYYYQSSW